MALLIDIGQPDWMRDEALRDRLQPSLPGVKILCAADRVDRAEVCMLACVKLAPGQAVALPGLQLVQKLGAGVDRIVADPDLPPQVRVTRLRPDAPAQEIAEYCVAYVLRDQRNMRFHEANAANCTWLPREPRESPRTTVGVLGLGQIGSRTARAFAALDFRILGWSRSPKAIESVECHAGDDALPGVLAACDYVAAVLPSTPQTRNLFDARRFAAMKPGAVLINVGRGDLVVEQDLLAALDGGRLAGAVLDVFRREPLPADHPFWAHPKITVTPHVSGWRLTGGWEVVAENYARLRDGRPLLHEVDRAAGY